jgi:O-antigen ligase
LVTFGIYSIYFLPEFFSDKVFFNYFCSAYQFFIVIISCLGLYGYSSFAVIGKGQGDLIPYLMPVNRALRSSGIYGQSNLFALVLLTGILVLVYSHLHNNKWITYQFPNLIYLPLLTVSVAFFLTGSRAGFLAFLFSIGTLIWLILRKRYLQCDNQQKMLFAKILCVLVLGFIVSCVLNYFLSSSGGARAVVVSGRSLDARLVFWTSAVLIFLDYPWFGVGLGNYKYYISQYMNEAHDILGFVQYDALGYTKWAHNELLQLLCECGIFVFLIVFMMLFLYVYQIFQYGKGKYDWTPLKMFSYLFLMPFIVQSMFSWPMRHPALLILFSTFLGLLLSQHQFKAVSRLPSWWKIAIRLVALAGLVFILSLGYQERQLRFFASRLEGSDLTITLNEFESLVLNPYLELPLLLNVTPRYVQAAMRKHDVDFAGKIFPYVKRLAMSQGAHWQWYNLSLTYHLLGKDSDAQSAVQRAIDLWPVEKRYWNFQHYLNMLKASRTTGRPIEDFFPIPPGGAAEDLEGLFDFDDRPKINL